MENAKLVAKLGETEALNDDIQKELENLSRMREKLLLMDNTENDNPSEERNVDMTKQLEELNTINKDLKDQNDELILQLEVARTDKER